MGQGKSVPRVSSGVPWWLWLTAAILTAAVVLGILASQNEESVETIFARAVAAAEGRQKDVLKESIDELRRRDGESDRVAVLQGIDAGANNRYPRSVELLKPFLDHADPELQTLAIKYSAIGYQLIGDGNAARSLHLKCIEMAPTDIQPRLLLLGLYSVAGATQPAAELAEEILELDPTNQVAADTLTSAKVETGQPDEALRLYETLLATEGDRASASPDMIVRYLTCLLDKDQTDAATKFLDENDSLVSDYLTRFAIYLRNGRLDDADALLERLKAPPGSVVAIRTQAAHAMQSEDWDLAIQLLGQAAFRMPRSMEVYRQLKLAAMKGNQPELVAACQANIDGIHELRTKMQNAVKAIGMDMQDPQLRMNVARVAEELGLRQEAEKWHRAAFSVASEEQAKSLNEELTFTMPVTPLVPIPTAFGATVSGESDSSTDPAPETAEPSEPEATTPDSSGDEPEESAEEPTESADQLPAE